MIYSLVRRELRGRYKGSVLGFLWTYINPLCQVIVYSMVFSVIFRVNIDKFYLYLIIGMMPWTFFNTSVQFYRLPNRQIFSHSSYPMVKSIMLYHNHFLSHDHNVSYHHFRPGRMHADLSILMTNHYPYSVVQNAQYGNYHLIFCCSNNSTNTSVHEAKLPLTAVFPACFLYLHNMVSAYFYF